MENDIDSSFDHQLQDGNEVDSSIEAEESFWQKYNNSSPLDITA